MKDVYIVNICEHIRSKCSAPFKSMLTKRKQKILPHAICNYIRFQQIILVLSILEI